MKYNPSDNPYPSARQVVYANKGMVATTQPLAAQAGLDIIKAGGNAVDAAIATAACLTVTEPTSNGIGSDAFAIVWAKDKMYGLNSSGKAPMGISIQKLKAAGHDVMPKFGWTPVTVPGAPGAWAALSERFGKLSLSECLRPAANYARQGYPVSPVVAANWQNAFNAYDRNRQTGFDEWFKVFAPKGRAPLAGEIWASPNHADSLEEIGETQAESFYKGRLANEIAAASSKQGGYFALSDLAGFSPEWVEPITVNYRGYDVWELPPNGQGIVALIALNILKTGNSPKKDTFETYHRQIEAVKLAFSSGKQTVTDPAHMEVSSEDLLSEDYAAKLSELITEKAQLPSAPLPKKSGTVYLATADGEGNMVSYIQSNYMGFGSGIVVPGTGIAMQNRGADFSLEPENINSLAGGKRTYHTIIPGFLTKDGSAVGPFGIMGGYMQPQAHVQVLMNCIDFKLNPQAALDAPRWQWTGGNDILLESGFPGDIAEKLAELGHNISITSDVGTFGRGQIIWKENGVLAGGCEPRADSAVVGW